MRGKHGQHELDGIRQLHRDHRMGGESGFDEMRRQCGDGAIGLLVGQSHLRLAGDARLVRGIDQRYRIPISGHDPLKQCIERRRCVRLIHLGNPIIRTSWSIEVPRITSPGNPAFATSSPGGIPPKRSP